MIIKIRSNSIKKTPILRNNTNANVTQQIISPSVKKSYGCILYTMIENIPYYILIQNKYTYYFGELLNSKYYNENNLDLKYLSTLLYNITKIEQKLLNTLEFKDLWELYWCNYDDKNKDNSSYEKNLANFTYIKTKYNDLFNINIEKIYTCWDFPKGKKIFTESNEQCSVRETCEELNIKDTDIYINNSKIYEETILGINNILYNNIYTLAEYKSDIFPYYSSDNKYQISEISDIGIFNFNEIKHYLYKKGEYISFRKYKIIKEINNMLLNKKC